MKKEKMEVNSYFCSGLACGICLGITMFALRKSLNRFFIRTGASDAITKKTKPVKEPVFDDNGEYKMVLVVRNDLKMGKGKVAAQCAHAAVGAYAKACKNDRAALQLWEYTGQAKIALKVESEEELMQVMNSAKEAGLITSLIRDAGRTQIAPNSKTVLGIGPASKSAIDKVTGHLKLF